MNAIPDFVFAVRGCRYRADFLLRQQRAENDSSITMQSPKE
jgi:hypothetical protein